MRVVPPYGGRLVRRATYIFTAAEQLVARDPITTKLCTGSHEDLSETEICYANYSRSARTVFADPCSLG